MTKESVYVSVALEGTSPCGSTLTRLATGPGICIDPFKFDDAYIWLDAFCIVASGTVADGA